MPDPLTPGQQIDVLQAEYTSIITEIDAIEAQIEMFEPQLEILRERRSDIYDQLRHLAIPYR